MQGLRALDGLIVSPGEGSEATFSFLEQVKPALELLPNRSPFNLVFLCADAIQLAATKSALVAVKRLVPSLLSDFNEVGAELDPAAAFKFLAQGAPRQIFSYLQVGKGLVFVGPIKDGGLLSSSVLPRVPHRGPGGGGGGGGVKEITEVS